MPVDKVDKNGYPTRYENTLRPEWWDTSGRNTHTEMCVCGHERRQHLYASPDHPCAASKKSGCGCKEFTPAEPKPPALPHGFPWTDEELMRTCASCGHRWGLHSISRSAISGSGCSISGCGCKGYVDPLGFSEKPKPVSETMSHRLGECKTCGHLPQEHAGENLECTKRDSLVQVCRCEKYVFPEGARDAH